MNAIKKSGGYVPPQEYIGDGICAHGCGNTAKYKQKNGILLCQYSYRSCPSHAEKRKAAMLKKFGVESLMHSPEFQKKIQENNLKKFGFRTPFERPENLEKAKAACVSKFGVDNVFKLKEIQESIKSQNLNKYGCENIAAAPGITDKMRETWRNHTPEQNKEILDKRQRACLEKFGFRHQLQNPDIMRKVLSSSAKNRSRRFELPSGAIVILAGYEPIVLDELLQQGYQEADFDFKQETLPHINYLGGDDKEHRYFPDFYLPKYNLIIEVKNMYLFKKEKDQNLRKYKRCKEMGFNFNFIIRKSKRKLKLLKEIPKL